ncbi:MAG: hypothetical protein Q7R94_02885 [bacterium]|nr:hypothetical protein [bacterium]
MKKLTAVEVSKRWKVVTDEWYWAMMVPLVVVFFLISLFLGVDNGATAVFGAVVFGIMTIVWIPRRIYYLIRYGKTGRLINRWVKITGKSIESFPMNPIVMIGLKAWARKEIEKSARAYAAAKRYVEEIERSYEDALAGGFSVGDIEPDDVPKMDQQVTDWKTNLFNLTQRLEGAKRGKARTQSEYDAWWNLLRDLQYFPEKYITGFCLLPINEEHRHFRNPAEFSKWVKDEDARKEREQTEVVGYQQLAPPPPPVPQLVPQLVTDRGVGGKK